MKFKNKELKEIIKHYVHESLIEILAESKIQNIVEETIIKKNIFNENYLSSNNHQQNKVVEKNNLLEQRKMKMLDKLRVPGETWASIYQDTAQSNNSILTNESNPELVSEHTLQAMGVMNKDFSKFFNTKENSNNLNNTNENWEELFEKRKKLLSEKIK